ncbi:unnamed protein product [Toxocara canis]|uniref:Peptidase_M14 domain-containing protein n=1 Tax=Toxocara canis TaxID=6265 RepID=A0A183UQW8_TOXCA|nr:unnamed protein product [Toxocara canis]
MIPEADSSKDPCSDIYAGPHALSEPEVRAISRFVAQHSPNVQAYIDVHAYGEYVMFPFGYSLTFPSNYVQLRDLAMKAKDAIDKVNNEQFESGSLAQVVYKASGISIDYMRATLNIPLSFGMELRPMRDVVEGYIIAPQEIIPGASEAWAGIQEILKEVAK